MPRIRGFVNGDPPLLSALAAGVGTGAGCASSDFLRLLNFSPMLATIPVIVSVKLASSPSNADASLSFSSDGVISTVAFTCLGFGLGFVTGFGADFATGFAAGFATGFGAAFALGRGFAAGCGRLAALGFGAGAALSLLRALKADSGASRWCLTDASTARRARPGDTGFSKNR